MALAIRSLRKDAKFLNKYGSCGEKVCDFISIKKFGSQWTARANFPGKSSGNKFEIKKDTLHAVIDGAKKLVEKVHEELIRRFKNTSIMNATYVLRADYYEPESEAETGAGVAPKKLGPAMKTWANHFAVNLDDLKKEFRTMLALFGAFLTAWIS